MAYHSVEKALSLRSPRRPFGASVDARLSRYLPEARARAPQAAYVQSAAAAQEALHDWNVGNALDDGVAPSPTHLAAEARLDDPFAFFTTRHSVRNFQGSIPSDEILNTAITLATRSPSVCNRQPWLVRFYSGEAKRGILRYQDGNRGFGDEIPKVALVSVDLGYFVGLGERNQAWIEGGIFSSTLVWALHALGVDTCMLNLSLRNGRAQKLRAAAGMRPSEVPITMIAIGYASTGARVARSVRRQETEIVRSAS
ncbi:nitroreductase family protein [Agromyces larvae]|uniref:nitroreductase family protein n=1 Tax=Agromyces larvae TaxID=2929802 RepID=UPI00338F6DFB